MFFFQNSSHNPDLSLGKITQDLNNGALLIDVRTPGEYQEGHAVGAVNLPLQNIEQGQLNSLNKNQKIYLYCQSGHRSAQAKSILNQAGFVKTIDLASLRHWQSLGGEIT